MATVLRMSRLLAALLLVAFAWSQAYAADCPLAAQAAGEGAYALVAGAAHDPAHASAGAHASTETHAHHPHAPRKAPPEHHHAAECVLSMACGVAALPHRAAESTVPLQSSASVAWPAISAYHPPVLGSDPPPPRLA